MKIKYSFAIFASSALLFFSCGKENPTPPQYGSVLFYNAATTKLTDPVMSFFANDSIISNGFVQYGTSTGYMGILPGEVSLELKQDPGTVLPNAPTVAEQTVTMNANDAYTFISYDSLSTSNTVKSVLLKDDLTVPHVDSAKVRFWLLAPAFPSASVHSADVTYVRTSVTPNDSVTLSNRTYPGANPAAPNLQDFTTIPSGTYTIKFKQVGTQTVITQATGVAVARRRIISHSIIGGVNGRSLAIGSVTYF